MASNLLPQHGRYEYSPITERKDYSWPGDKRLAFCITTRYRRLLLHAANGEHSGR